jgi:hypothetical protein
VIFEEYHEPVCVDAFVDSDNAVMNVGLDLGILHIIFGIGIMNAREKIIVLTRGDQHLPWLELACGIQARAEPHF